MSESSLIVKKSEDLAPHFIDARNVDEVRTGGRPRFQAALEKTTPDLVK